MKIYVASSWKNERYPAVVARLRTDGHDVYDFRNPTDGSGGFTWTPPADGRWTSVAMLEQIDSDDAVAQFNNDSATLGAADLLVLVLPSGRSAHMEAGCAIGAGTPTLILMDTAPDPNGPELMWGLADGYATDLDELSLTIRQIGLLRDMGRLVATGGVKVASLEVNTHTPALLDTIDQACKNALPIPTRGLSDAADIVAKGFGEDGGG